jgi:hypothetical protein
MYRAIGLLQSDTDFDLDAAASRLAAKIPGSSSTRSGDLVTVTSGDWELYIAVASGPEVASEIEGLVGRLAGIEAAEAETYVATGRRVEVWSDTPDPFMEHFNDYLSAVEVLKSFRGLLAVDPKEPGVL